MDVQSRRDGQELYEFGEFTLDVPERRLTRGAFRVHLAPKTYDVIVALVRRAGHLVTKRELLNRIWPDVFVEEGILTVHVATLRKALGDMRRLPWYIETSRGRAIDSSLRSHTPAPGTVPGPMVRCGSVKKRGGYERVVELVGTLL